MLFLTLPQQGAWCTLFSKYSWHIRDSRGILLRGTKLSLPLLEPLIRCFSFSLSHMHSHISLVRKMVINSWKSLKVVWYCHKDRNADQWDRIESPKISLHIYGQLIFDKLLRTIQWEKEWSLQQMVLEQLDVHMQKNKVRPLTYTIHNSNLK